MTRELASQPAGVAHALGGLPGYAEMLGLLTEDLECQAGGVHGSFARYLAAQLFRDMRVGVLYLTPEVRSAERAVIDLETFGSDDGSAPLYFPPREADDGDGSQSSHARRLALLYTLLSPEPRVVVTSLAALWQPVLAPSQLRALSLHLAASKSLAPEALALQLNDAGYEAVRSVTYPGEYTQRGGMFDLFSFGSDAPLRLEYFGDTIESVRCFDPQTQRSTGTVESARVSLAAPGRLRQGDPPRGNLLDYLGRNAVRILQDRAGIDRYLGGADPEITPRYSDARRQQLYEGIEAGPLLEFSEFSYATPSAVQFQTRPPTSFAGDLAGALSGVQGLTSRFDEIHLYFDNMARRARLLRMLEEAGVDRSPLRLHHGQISGGFELSELGQVHLPYDALFDRVPTTLRRGRTATPPAQHLGTERGIQAFLSFSPGDLVVHQVHGIGRFLGISAQQRDGHEEEMLRLEYHGGTALNLPVTQAELVQRYVGNQGFAPRLDRLGGRSWIRKKERVEVAVADLAKEMLALQASRAQSPGIAHPENAELQQEFEQSFLYDETTDQLRACGAIAADMSSTQPMDRLLCGDVGFGKTEVALRAAFRAIAGGRQVAFLVPTTVLAEQHHRTLTERFEQHPLRIEALSRFRTPAEQQEILTATAAGQVDLLIGTHRLLQADVEFARLGLLIIDEEQRFGVQDKAVLRTLRTQVDVLTLSATPIPRTLHMALVGLHDISTLTTAPRDRHAIVTRVVPFSESLVREGILRELARNGQVLFVHNRVQTIHAMAARLAEICPEASYRVGHGQLPERELEAVMLAFVNGEVDVLVTTTIIESGLDIPNANTIFIDRADRFGLAELHQLRGRIGRYHHQAYATLLLPPQARISDVARRRLKAIEEHSELGSGFELAMRDLEIRGAGNLLGKEQSGHMASVGYATYCRLLENAVAGLSGAGPGRPDQLTSVDLAIGASLPAGFVPAEEARIELYARLSRVCDIEEVAGIEAEIRDRFGPLPEPARRLIRIARLRVITARRGVQMLRRTADRIVLIGQLDGLGELEPFSLPIRPIEPDTALLVLPDGVAEGAILELLERFFRMPDSDAY